MHRVVTTLPPSFVDFLEFLNPKGVFKVVMGLLYFAIWRKSIMEQKYFFFLIVGFRMVTKIKAHTEYPQFRGDL